MKVAVCLSGQPRTLKYCVHSIKSFFGDVDYFCHVWDYNDYKVKNHETKKLEWLRETVTHDEIKQSLGIFQPLDYLIQGVDDLPHPRFGWESMMYSNLMAVNMKKCWEIKNNFRYDLVIKSRYDLVYPHGKRFTPSVRMKYPAAYHPNYDLFTAHTGRMQGEFFQINISDVTYYGSSMAMDIAADLYWHMQREYADTRNQVKLLGPGTWMADYISTNNLRFHEDIDNIKEVVFRTSSIGLSIEHDWATIVSNHGNIYI